MYSVRLQDLQVLRFSWWQYKPRKEVGPREYFTKKFMKFSRGPETRNLGPEFPLNRGCTVAKQFFPKTQYQSILEPDFGCNL